MTYKQVPLLITFLIALQVSAGEPIDIGTRRELFVDHFVIERFDGVRLELRHDEDHAPLVANLSRSARELRKPATGTSPY